VADFIKRMRKSSAAADIGKVVLPYLLFASLWILVSDSVVVFLFRDPLQIAAASTLKGWAFVVVTASLLSVQLRRLIARLKQVESDLRQQHAELERFIYTLSHDLKSPLITVRTFMGYLEQDMATDDNARIEQDMDYIRTATEKMEQMLGELLEVSRIGRLVNPPTLVTFRELAAEALDTVAGSIASRGVAVTLGDEIVTLRGDRLRLVEIWQNLVENAVKYMGDQAEPRIEISSEQNGKETVFFVSDNGIGLEAGNHERIFELFVRLEPQGEGAGIGLALTKRIVAMYQGKIWVESAGTGRGCRFSFTLPGALMNYEL